MLGQAQLSLRDIQEFTKKGRFDVNFMDKIKVRHCANVLLVSLLFRGCCPDFTNMKGKKRSAWMKIQTFMPFLVFNLFVAVPADRVKGGV